MEKYDIPNWMEKIQFLDYDIPNWMDKSSCSKAPAMFGYPLVI